MKMYMCLCRVRVGVRESREHFALIRLHLMTKHLNNRLRRRLSVTLVLRRLRVTLLLRLCGRSLERLLEVCDNVVDVLDAD
jgi:hypothetical protein